MGRAEVITRNIQSHDYKLYCTKNQRGTLCIYRKSDRVETYKLDDGDVIHFIRPSPHFVMALTDDWSIMGRDADWGILPIMKRLNDLDLHKRDIVSEIERAYEKREELEKRTLSNETEAFASDFRSTFKKMFSDVNTSNMAKKDSRREKDKRIKQS